MKSAIPSVLSYGHTGMVLDGGQALMDNRSLSFQGEVTRLWSGELEEIGHSTRLISYSQPMEHSSHNSLSSLSVTATRAKSLISRMSDIKAGLRIVNSFQFKIVRAKASGCTTLSISDFHAVSLIQVPGLNTTLHQYRWLYRTRKIQGLKPIVLGYFSFGGKVTH